MRIRYTFSSVEFKITKYNVLLNRNARLEKYYTYGYDYKYDEKLCLIPHNIIILSSVSCSFINVLHTFINVIMQIL